MKKIVALAMFFFIAWGIFAQNNYQAAYVIMPENEHVSGLVDFRLAKHNQEACHFKENENSPVTVYSPEDILGYRFTATGKYYVPKTIDIEGDSKTVFVEFMVEGMMNLYYYEHDNGLRYFFFEDENGKLFSVTKNNDKLKDYQMRKDMKYDGIIRYQFRDYYPIVHYPDTIGFNQKSMIDIVKTYHDAVCTTGESCIIYENETPDKMGVKFNWSVYAGVECLAFVYDNRNKAIMIVRPVATIGCEFELSYPQLVNNLSFLTDISFGRLESALDVNLNRLEGESTYSYYKKITFDAYPFSFRAGFKYAYPLKRFNPMVELAFAYKYMGDNFEVHKYIGAEELGDFSGQYDRNYFGAHLAVGSDYRFKNGHAVFLKLFFEPYINKKFNPKLPTLSDAFFSSGVKVGYTF